MQKKRNAYLMNKITTNSVIDALIQTIQQECEEMGTPISELIPNARPNSIKTTSMILK